MAANSSSGGGVFSASDGSQWISEMPRSDADAAVPSVSSNQSQMRQRPSMAEDPAAHTQRGGGMWTYEPNGEESAELATSAASLRSPSSPGTTRSAGGRSASVSVQGGGSIEHLTGDDISVSDVASARPSKKEIREEQRRKDNEFRKRIAAETAAFREEQLREQRIHDFDAIVQRALASAKQRLLKLQQKEARRAAGEQVSEMDSPQLQRRGTVDSTISMQSMPDQTPVKSPRSLLRAMSMGGQGDGAPAATRAATARLHGIMISKGRAVGARLTENLLEWTPKIKFRLAGVHDCESTIFVSVGVSAVSLFISTSMDISLPPSLPAHPITP
jgi:hypothetical protein